MHRLAWKCPSRSQFFISGFKFPYNFLLLATGLNPTEINSIIETFYEFHLWISKMFYIWIIELSNKWQKISDLYIASNASFSVYNSPKSLATEAPPQTPLGTLQPYSAPPDPLAVIGWGRDLVPPSGFTQKMSENSDLVYSTKCFLFSIKFTKNRWRQGLLPRPRWGAYSAPPDPLAVMGWDRYLVPPSGFTHKNVRK